MSVLHFIFPTKIGLYLLSIKVTIKLNFKPYVSKHKLLKYGLRVNYTKKSVEQKYVDYLRSTSLNCLNNNFK